MDIHAFYGHANGNSEVAWLPTDTRNENFQTRIPGTCHDIPARKVDKRRQWEVLTTGRKFRKKCNSQTKLKFIWSTFHHFGTHKSPLQLCQAFMSWSVLYRQNTTVHVSYEKLHSAKNASATYPDRGASRHPQMLVAAGKTTPYLTSRSFTLWG